MSENLETAGSPGPGSLPTPTAEHQRLEDAVGKWRVACTYWLGADQPPFETQAFDTIERLGPYWVVTSFRSDMMGAPFTGRATVGYDPQQRRWLAMWVDSMSPFLYSLSGNFDDAGRVLTMTGVATSITGRSTRLETREEHVSRDHRVIDMFAIGDAGERAQMFRFVYRRLK